MFYFLFFWLCLYFCDFYFAETTLNIIIHYLCRLSCLFIDPIVCISYLFPHPLFSCLLFKIQFHKFLFWLNFIHQPNIYNSGMIQLLKLTRVFCSKIKPSRKLIVPQKFSVQPAQQQFHVTSKNYDFLIKTNPSSCSQIYVHNSDTPSNLLKKNAIHIFPDAVPQHSVQQKYRAHIKRLEQGYKKSFQGCKTPAQVFHLSRRIKSDIRNKCSLIGKISGKYKHYNLFKSLNQLNSETTLQQYKKNGIQVPMLGKNKIFPQGPVWLPTTDAYLKLLQKYISQNIKQTPSTILDLGCGSGILSFILGKQYKKSSIFAVDSNKYAVDTCSVNAATLQLTNISSFVADITKLDNLAIQLKQIKAPLAFDIIITNPPWLIAKKAQKQSQILDGVYDEKGKFLNSAFKIANTYLKDKKSRLILIYSDLSHHLGIQSKPIDQLCKQNNLIVYSKLQSDYPKAITKESPLAPYKLKSKVQLYQIGKS